MVYSKYFDISGIFGIKRVDQKTAEKIFNDSKSVYTNTSDLSLIDQYLFSYKEANETTNWIIMSILMKDGSTEIVVFSPNGDEFYTSANFNALPVYGSIKLVEAVCEMSDMVSVSIEPCNENKCSCETENFGYAPSSPTACDDDHVLNTLQARWS